MAAIPQAALDWIVGDDTGMSSKCIWGVMVGAGPDGFRSYPLDPDDFGRCHRLLQAVPEWRARLSEMAAVSKQWAGLVADWDAIEAAFVAETKGERWWHSAPATYALMKKALGERP